MARTKATVRRMPVIVSGNENISFKRRSCPPFKIKKILPETRTVSVKKKWTENQRDES